MRTAPTAPETIPPHTRTGTTGTSAGMNEHNGNGTDTRSTQNINRIYPAILHIFIYLSFIALSLLISL